MLRRESVLVHNTKSTLPGKVKGNKFPSGQRGQGTTTISNLLAAGRASGASSACPPRCKLALVTLPELASRLLLPVLIRRGTGLASSPVPLRKRRSLLGWPCAQPVAEDPKTTTSDAQSRPISEGRTDARTHGRTDGLAKSVRCFERLTKSSVLMRDWGQFWGTGPESTPRPRNVPGQSCGSWFDPPPSAALDFSDYGLSNYNGGSQSNNTPCS